MLFFALPDSNRVIFLISKRVTDNTLNGTVLLNSLNMAQSNLGTEDKSIGYELHSTSNILSLRQKFIIDVLTGFYKNNSEIEKHLQLLEIKLENNNVLPIIMAIDDYKSISSENSLRDTSLLEFSIMNVTNEILAEAANGVCTHISGEQFIILLSFAHTRSMFHIETAIHSLLENVSSLLSKFLGISVTFSVGSLCPSLSCISNSFNFAEKNLSKRFYSGKGSILKGSELSTTKNIITGLSIDAEKQILSFLKLGQIGKVEEMLNTVFDYIQSEYLSPSSTRMIINDLLGLVTRVCKENGLNFNEVFAEGTSPFEKLYHMDTIEDIRHWITPVFNKVMLLLSKETVDTSSGYIKKAISLIKTRYQQNISLADIAEELKISSTYLSKIFKDETEMGFTAYLCNLRLEKQKLLSRKADMN